MKVRHSVSSTNGGITMTDIYLLKRLVSDSRLLLQDFGVRPSQSSEGGEILNRVEDALFSRDLARALLKDVSEFPQRYRAATHDNGFHKITLFSEQSNPVTVRLNIWDSQSVPFGNETAPHTHRWNLASWPLCGEVFSETYDEVEYRQTTSLFTRYKRSKLSDGRYEMVFDRRSSLQISSVELRRPFSLNILSYQKIHRASAANDKIACTIAITAAPGGEVADFAYYRAHVWPEGSSRAHSPLGNRELAEKASNVLRHWGK